MGTVTIMFAVVLLPLAYRNGICLVGSMADRNMPAAFNPTKQTLSN